MRCQYSWSIAITAMCLAACDSEAKMADMAKSAAPDMTSLLTIDDACRPLISNVLLNCRANPADPRASDCVAPASLYQACPMLCAGGMNCETDVNPPKISGVYKETNGSTHFYYLTKPPEVSINGLSDPLGFYVVQLTGNKMSQRFTVYYSVRRQSQNHTCFDYEITVLSGLSVGVCPADMLTKLRVRTVMLTNICQITSDIFDKPIFGAISKDRSFPDWERQRDSTYDPPCP